MMGSPLGGPGAGRCRETRGLTDAVEEGTPRPERPTTQTGKSCRQRTADLKPETAEAVAEAPLPVAVIHVQLTLGVFLDPVVLRSTGWARLVGNPGPGCDDEVGMRSEACTKVDVLAGGKTAERIIEADVTDDVGAKTHEPGAELCDRNRVTVAQVVGSPVDWLSFVIERSL